MANHVPCGIVGNGRMANHFCRYLELSEIPYKQWSRKNSSNLNPVDFFQGCRAVLILIKDDAIPAFIERYPQLKDMNPIHFSGSLYCAEIASIHPLMTFNQDFYSLEKYQKIPFISEENRISFKELFPELPNPSQAISAEKKEIYHSLCVLAGNFTTMLWQKAFADFQNTLKLDSSILIPYMEQTFENIKSSPLQALTGPLIRNDQKTISSNLNALRGDPYQKVYLAFLKVLTKKENKYDNT